MASFNPFDDVFSEANNTSPSSAAGGSRDASKSGSIEDIFGSESSSPSAASNGAGNASKTSAVKPPLHVNVRSLSKSKLETSPQGSPSSSRAERRRRMSRASSTATTTSEEGNQTNDPFSTMALRRNSIMSGPSSMTSAIRGLTISDGQAGDAAADNGAAGGSVPADGGESNGANQGGEKPTVLCPNCGASNIVPQGKTFFNCCACSLEMVAKLSDVPKASRLQCPNCSRSIVAPPNCDMFKCICGQTMVVPGSEMAKRIQKQGTRAGEAIFVQDKSEIYGNVWLRVTSKKIFKKWSTRFFSIQRDRLLLFRSKLKAAQGSSALLIIPLHARQEISSISDTTNKDCDLLHMITLYENSRTASPRNRGSVTFSRADPVKVACELASGSLEAAKQLREKLEATIHKCQVEARKF